VCLVVMLWLLLADGMMVQQPNLDMLNPMLDDILDRFNAEPMETCELFSFMCERMAMTSCVVNAVLFVLCLFVLVGFCFFATIIYVFIFLLFK